MKKIKVLIIDDSALIRQTITKILENEPAIDVVGTAYDPFCAIEKINSLKPDVLLLDIQMPKMDGLTFLQKIMKHKPIPTIIFSSFVEEGSVNALRALEYGAVEVIEKPKLRTKEELEKYRLRLISTIKAASLSKPKHLSDFKSEKKFVTKFIPSDKINFQNFIIAIGASTGGTEAIRIILEAIPANFPPIVITQHMPVGFTKSFAERLNQLCTITVKEAEDGETLQPGYAYIARGDRHLIVKRRHGFIAELDNSEKVNRHKPSVDVLFNSVAKVAGSNAIGIILTGMGADGAEGLKKMKNKGAYTIAQDEESCVVFGMPRVAIEIGATDIILPIQKIAWHLKQKLSIKTP